LRLKHRVIDLDLLKAVPVCLCPRSPEQLFFRPEYVEDDNSIASTFHIERSELFQEQFNKLQRHQSEFVYQNFFQKSLRGVERFFIQYLFENQLAATIDAFPDMVWEVIRNSTKTPLRIKYEWESFVTEFFTSRGRAIPNWDRYIEVQEGLGLIGKSDRRARVLKRKAQEVLKGAFYVISNSFPHWNWAAKRHCYLVSAGTSRYRLTSGSFHC
jgi:hypothetical protein